MAARALPAAGQVCEATFCPIVAVGVTENSVAVLAGEGVADVPFPGDELQALSMIRKQQRTQKQCTRRELCCIVTPLWLLGAITNFRKIEAIEGIRKFSTGTIAGMLAFFCELPHKMRLTFQTPTAILNTETIATRPGQGP